MHFPHAVAISVGISVALVSGAGTALADDLAGDPSHAVYTCELSAPPNDDPFFTGERVVIFTQSSTQSFVRSAERPIIEDWVSNFCLEVGSW
jgi:hypothetical protein